MNLISLGILIIVGIIVIAAIFNASFQEKIFGGAEGEARIAGIISVKGVSFTVLLVGLLGLASYQEGQSKKFDNVDSDVIIKQIISANNLNFTFKLKGKDSILVYVNDIFIKQIHQSIDFAIQKSADEKFKYDVSLDNKKVEQIDLDFNKSSMAYDEGDIYYEHEAYQYEETGFWFKLDSIITTPSKKVRYEFLFGEGESSESIQWIEKSLAFGKSDNGRTKGDLHILSMKGWEKCYALNLGAGNFGSGNGRNHIEMISINLAMISVGD